MVAMPSSRPECAVALPPHGNANGVEAFKQRRSLGALLSIPIAEYELYRIDRLLQLAGREPMSGAALAHMRQFLQGAQGRRQIASLYEGDC
jgi:hypothetical protein